MPSKKKGFSLRWILKHSIWIPIMGIIIFRLGTANTQTVIYGQIFTVFGVVMSTAPWIIQLLISTAIIFMHRAKLYDLTWLVMQPSKETSCCQDIKLVEEVIRARIGKGNVRGTIDAVQGDGRHSTPRGTEPFDN